MPSTPVRLWPYLLLYAIGTSSACLAQHQAPPAPAPAVLKTRPGPQPTPAAGKAKLAYVNGQPYKRPTQHDLFLDYRQDTYGWPALARTSIRAIYAEGRGKPAAWTGGTGFAQRFGSSAAITVIDGNVRYGMEELFHEDLRYVACHGCRKRDKLANALLAEITARHDSDGHRFFTLTPTIADFSGPLIAHSIWYPGAAEGPVAGLVSARLVFATRIFGHLFREFVLDRKLKKPELGQ